MPKKKTITAFALSMINVAAIASLRNLPVAAIHGFHLIFYLAMAALFFFIPTALIAAELVAHYPEEGGIYIWVRTAFGKRIGFLAVWLQWLGVLIWYPTSLVFIASTIGSLISPSLVEHPSFAFFCVTLLFWGCTWINFRGMEVSSWISTCGVILGTLIPGLAIILLGLFWWGSGEPLQIQTGWLQLIPSTFKSGQLALLCGIAVSFIGMEMSEVHASDVKNPQKTFPKAILISSLIIFSIYALGSLAIAFVIPPKTLSLTAGVIDAFATLLAAYGASWLKPLVALLIILGALTGVSTWIVGPSRGILIAAKEGHLPAYLCKRNSAGMPAHIMILQGVIVTLLTSFFLFMPSVKSAFILLTVIGSHVVMVMYALMFAAAVALRKRRKKVNTNLYQIPFKWGLHIVALFGFIGVGTILTVGFFPPEGSTVLSYEITLIFGLLLGCLFPFAYHYFNPKSL